jgi:glycosyltransferase involved in cell wall biosynthesis
LISYPNTEGNLKLIWVNRLEPLKNPRNILRAISVLQNVKLTIIGSGTLDREVGEFIKKEKLENRVTWIKSMTNAEIITEMQNNHIFIGNCNYPGITKGTIEAALAGRVIILNRNKYASTEITDEWVQICEDSLEGYKSAICQFLNNPEFMPRLFNETQRFAYRKFHPNLIDEQWVDVYKRLGN